MSACTLKLLPILASIVICIVLTPHATAQDGRDMLQDLDSLLSTLDCSSAADRLMRERSMLAPDDTLLQMELTRRLVRSLLCLNDIDFALRQWDDYHERFPSHATGYMYHALNALDVRRLEESRRAVDHATRLQPGHPFPHMLLATVYAIDGPVDSLQQPLVQASMLVPNRTTWKQLTDELQTRCQRAQGRYCSLIRALADSLQVNALFTETRLSQYIDSMKALIHVEKFQEALGFVDRALRTADSLKERLSEHIQPLRVLKAELLEKLGTDHLMQERFSEALLSYSQSLELRRTMPSGMEAAIAGIHVKLAAAYRALDRYEEAEGHTLRALELFGDVLGDESAEYRSTREFIQKILLEHLSAEDTEEGRDRIIEKIQDEFGDNSIAYAKSLQVQAAHAFHNGQWPAARTLLEESGAILADLENVPGQYQWELNLNLVVIYVVMKNFSAALPLLDDIISGMIRGLERTAANRDESLLITQWHKYSTLLQLLPSMLRKWDLPRRNVEAAIIETELFRKGFLAEAIREMRDRSQNRTKSARGSTAKAHNTPENDSAVIFSTVDWRTIESALQPGEAMMDVMRYEYYDGLRETDSVFYAAILIQQGMQQSPEYVELFEEKELLPYLIPDLHTADQNSQIPGYLRATSDGMHQANIIYRYIFGALRQTLPSIRTLYLCPDGVLHNVAFEALVDDSARYLGESNLQIRRISSPRKMLQRSGSEQAPGRITLFANPDFDRLLQSGRTQGSYEIHQNWTRLRRSGEHAMRVSRLFEDNGWKAELRLDRDAEEAAIIKMRAPRVLEIATHGYYGDILSSDDATTVPLSSASFIEQMNEAMERSGLVLAGANNTGNAGTRENDGYLTAREISHLNLSGTELVVLAACQSALADFTSGEGTFGMGRAFRTAGAKAVLMSLWEIPETESLVMIEEFYASWLRHGDMDEALRTAQGKIRGRYADPWYWASFILVR